MRQRLFPIAIITCLIIQSDAHAQNELKLEKRYNIRGNTGIKGYDPVAYFVSDNAQKGSKKIQYTHDGVIYRFTSESNKQLFIGDPEKYLPAYGGFCAYGVGHDGKRFNVNPKAFKIIDGKNYLFWKRFIYDAIKRWDKDEEQLKINADRNWKKLLGKEIKEIEGIRK